MTPEQRKATSHTPGPWYIGTDFGDQGRHIYAKQTVCDDEGYEWNPLIASTDDDERMVNWQANALLIAAAPDLFNALVMVLDDPNALDGRPRTAEIVRAAIAKATGEQA